MPNATVTGKALRKDLKSCPGGWVELKPLNYDQLLTRRDNATKIFMEGKDNSDRMNLQIANRWSTLFDFRHCIADHNLEDDEGHKLDLSNQLTLQVLDPKVGAEIERYLMDLNQDVEDEDLQSFFLPATTSSMDNKDTTEPPGSTELS